MIQTSSPTWLLTSLSLSLPLILPLSYALWRVSPGWSIPIFSNWWTSSRPKKSTSFSLNCEFRCLMSQGKWLSAFPLLNCMCWLYTCGGMSRCGPRPCRYEHSSGLHSFGMRIWLLASCSILISVVFLGNLRHFHEYASCRTLITSFENTGYVGLGIPVRIKLIK